MNTTEDFLAETAVLAGLPADYLRQIARHGHERHYGTDESILQVEGPADVFHLIRSGLVAVEVESPNRGPLIIETLGSRDVLGISWLLPPFRWAFSARALEPTVTFAVDADPVRAIADADPAFGYELHKRFAGIIHQRLVAARVRALDLYGSHQ